MMQIGINLLNVGLDLLFVVNFGWESDGVAWATVIAQFGGLLFILFIFGLRYRKYWMLARWAAILDKKKITTLLTLNADLFIRTAALLAAHAYFFGPQRHTRRSCIGGQHHSGAISQYHGVQPGWLRNGRGGACGVVDGGEVASRKNRAAIRLTFIYGMGVGSIFQFGLFDLCARPVDPIYRSWRGARAGFHLFDLDHS